MNQRTKTTIIIFLGVALAALVLLSAGLSQLELKPGTPVPGSANGSALTQEEQNLSSRVDARSLSVLQTIFAVALLVLLISVPLRLIGLLNGRNVIRLVIAVVLLVALLSILPRAPGSQPVALPTEPSAAQNRTLPDVPVTPLGKPPAAFLWVAGAGVLLGAGLLGLHALRRTPQSAAETDGLSNEAENALQALERGENLSNVIIRWYLQMVQLMQAERSIERGDDMTVREFEDTLESRGIPADPVHKLTSLFEKARYSRETIDAHDEETGEESLKQIVEYCRKENAGAR